jgi:mono/diheme cytochrome c family protein
VKAIVPPPAEMLNREKNQEVAKADRQAVFRNDCATCHVDKSKGLLGAALYQQACGICHESDHRATFVPNLAALNHPTDANYWRLMIAEGKDKTLMPAFSQARGGPLSKDQIESLVTYLTTEFPLNRRPAPDVRIFRASPRQLQTK